MTGRVSQDFCRATENSRGLCDRPISSRVRARARDRRTNCPAAALSARVLPRLSNHACRLSAASALSPFPAAAREKLHCTLPSCSAWAWPRGKTLVLRLRCCPRSSGSPEVAEADRDRRGRPRHNAGWPKLLRDEVLHHGQATLRPPIRRRGPRPLADRKPSYWQLDVTFQENQSRLRRGHADPNFSILRRTALSR